MIDNTLEPMIEVEAARIAIDWKNLFASELDFAARQLAKGSELVTTEHYWHALPAATARVLQAVNARSTGSAYAERQIA